MRKITELLVASLICFQVQAASFDCAKAGTRVEKLICKDKVLSRQDEIMHTVYLDALNHVADPAGLKIEQRRWIETRNACKDLQCLAQAYRERLAKLQTMLAEPKPCYRLLERVWTDAKIVQSGHYPVCVAYLKNLNRFCNEASPACEYKLDPEIKELSRPDWEAIDPKTNFELIAESYKWRGRNHPPNETGWQVVKPEVLRRIDRGMVHLWQTRIRLASNEAPKRVIRVDMGCERTTVIGSDPAGYNVGGIPFVRVVDDETGKIDNRYDYLLYGIQDFVLHDSQTYLLQGYPGDDLIIQEPFSVSETHGKGMRSICVFEPQKK